MAASKSVETFFAISTFPELRCSGPKPGPDRRQKQTGTKHTEIHGSVPPHHALNSGPTAVAHVRRSNPAVRPHPCPGKTSHPQVANPDHHRRKQTIKPHQDVQAGLIATHTTGQAYTQDFSSGPTRARQAAHTAHPATFPSRINPETATCPPTRRVPHLTAPVPHQSQGHPVNGRTNRTPTHSG